jgi:hypothetical protein
MFIALKNTCAEVIKYSFLHNGFLDAPWYPGASDVQLHCIYCSTCYMVCMVLLVVLNTLA